MSKDEKIIRSGPFKGKKITFASTDRVEEFKTLADDFMLDVFELEPGDYAISDESAVRDFLSFSFNDAVRQRALPPGSVAFFKASGAAWHSRMDDALKQRVSSHGKSRRRIPSEAQRDAGSDSLRSPHSATSSRIHATARGWPRSRLRCHPLVPHEEAVDSIRRKNGSRN